MQQKRSKNATDKRGQTKTSVLGEELRYGPHFILKFRKAAKPVGFFRVVRAEIQRKTPARGQSRVSIWSH